jgi:DNA-binding MarR family transcriptional regulator
MSRQNPEQLLDCLLVTLGQGRLSPMEVRLLLWLAAREATPSELSEALGETPTAIERATRRLDMRGLIRRRFERGRDSRFIFSITSAGLLYLDPLVQCAAATGDTAHVA